MDANASKPSSQDAPGQQPEAVAIASVDRLLTTIKSLHAAHEQSEQQVAQRLSALENWERKVAARLRETWRWVDRGPFSESEPPPHESQAELEIDAAVKTLLKARETAASQREQACEARAQRDQAHEQITQLMQQLVELETRAEDAERARDKAKAERDSARSEREEAQTMLDHQRELMEASGIEIRFETGETAPAKPKASKPKKAA